MDLQRATDLLWESRQRGEAPPAELAKQLSLEQGQAIQLALLDRELAAGERQMGWKLAGTAPGIRERLGIAQPLRAPLMERCRLTSGADVASPEGVILFECELLVTVGRRLAGPGVDRAQVLGAVERVEAAFELPQMRVNVMNDVGFAVADGVAAWGVVVGDAAPQTPQDPGAIRVVAKKNGETLFDVLSRDTVEDQFESIAQLANELGALGRSIDPGHSILTGSFGDPVVTTAGDDWSAELSGVGAVSAQIR